MLYFSQLVTFFCNKLYYVDKFASFTLNLDLKSNITEKIDNL